MKVPKSGANKEKLPISELINDLKQDEEFADTCNDENEKYALSSYLSFTPAFPKGKQYKFKFVSTYDEKGDGHDESTTYGIFQRKSDDKYFMMWIHDRGLIGPGTLTMCDHLEEVSKKKTKMTKWS